MDGTTALAVLGIAEDATDDEVRRAYRARAKATHPDHGGSAEAFEAVTAAVAAVRAQRRARPACTARRDPYFRLLRSLDYYASLRREPDPPEPPAGLAPRPRVPRRPFDEAYAAALAAA